MQSVVDRRAAPQTNDLRHKEVDAVKPLRPDVDAVDASREGVAAAAEGLASFGYLEQPARRAGA